MVLLAGLGISRGLLSPVSSTGVDGLGGLRLVAVGASILWAPFVFLHAA